MNIDKSKLKYGIWFEDFEGNVLPCPDNVPVDYAPEGAHTRNIMFPLECNEEVFSIIDVKTCKHPRRCRQKDEYNGWTRWIHRWHGVTCERCGAYKYEPIYKPLIFSEWKHPSGKENVTFHKMMTWNHYINDEKLILAMANSGDYTLKEAIAILVNACERCLNVLANKYLGDEEGYPEHSEAWEMCNTECDFCKGETEEAGT